MDQVWIDCDKNGITNIDKDLIRLTEETVIEIDWINEGLKWIE